MLDSETKRRIDSARDILVGKVIRWPHVGESRASTDQTHQIAKRSFRDLEGNICFLSGLIVNQVPRKPSTNETTNTGRAIRAAV